MCASKDTSSPEGSAQPCSSKITSLEITRGLRAQTACCALPESWGFIPKELLECFVLARFKQLRQGKLHNPFATEASVFDMY